MNRIYISDGGDDKNDGRTRETAIYSWTRAIKLCDGNAETHLMQGDAHAAKARSGNREAKEKMKGSADRSRRHPCHDDSRFTVAWRSVLLPARCFTSTVSFG
jgi:hypothetical protein